MLKLLSALYGKVRAAWPVNRVVTVLTPIAFAPAAGYVATWAPRHLPGLGLQPTRAQLVGLFALGATRALVISYKWLDGWQKNEERVAWTAAQEDTPPTATSASVVEALRVATPPAAPAATDPPPPPAAAAAPQ